MTIPDPGFSDDTLTAAQLDSLLRLLSANPARAADEYEMLRRKLVKFFQWSSSVTAEELADKTLNRVARKVYEGTDEIRDVVAYALGVARMIRREANKRALKTIGLADANSKSLSDCGASAEALDATIQLEKEMRCLEECLERLPSDDRS